MQQKQSIPTVLWLAIASLAIFGVFHLIIGFSKPEQFIALIINIVLILGLLRLAKWAFFLAIPVSLLAPVLLSFADMTYFYFILIINLTVLVPVLLSYKSFFAKDANTEVTA